MNTGDDMLFYELKKFEMYCLDCIFKNKREDETIVPVIDDKDMKRYKVIKGIK
jgi:hypothetical protein